MYQVLLLLSLLIISVGCEDKTQDNNITVSNTLYPLEVAQIKLESNPSSVIVSNEYTIFRIGEDNGSYTLHIGMLDDYGQFHQKTSITEDAIYAYSSNMIDIDKNLFVVSGYNNVDKFTLYKIEQNNTVSTLSTTSVDTNISNASHLAATNAGTLIFQDGVVILTKLDDYIDYNTSSIFSKHRVFLYQQQNDNSFTPLQTLESEYNVTRGESYFGLSIALDQGIMALSETCRVDLFQQNSDKTYTKTDSYLFSDISSSNDDFCDLSITMKNNIITAYSRAYRKLYILQVKDAKIISSQDITDTNYRFYGQNSAIVDNALILARDYGVSIFTMQKNPTDVTLTKLSDINFTYTPDLMDYNGRNILISSLYRRDSSGIDILDAYPYDKVYIISDTNNTLTLDEEAIYSIYTINASSINPPLQYALNGDDAQFFQITGDDIFNTQKLNYESPVDLNHDNVYDVTLTITDAHNNENKIDFHVNLKDQQYIFNTNIETNETNATNQYLGVTLWCDNKDIIAGASQKAFLFHYDGNVTQTATFPNESNQTDNDFAIAVAKDGDIVLIGARAEDTNQSDEGSVYFYRYDSNNTSITAKYTLQPLLAQYSYFGSAIAIDSNITAIGAPGRLYAYRDPGSVYIYSIDANNTMNYIQTLQSTNPSTMELFGSAVAMDSGYLVVGAHYHSFDTGGYASGAAYLYKQNADKTYRLIDTLTPDTLDGSQYFGVSVAISKEYIVVGTSNSTNDIYIFKINLSGEHADKIATIHNDTVGSFGSKVAIGEKDIFVSNYDYQQEIVHHYTIQNDDSVILKETIINRTSPDILSFYHSIGIGDGFIAVGAKDADINASNSGTVTLFTKE